MSVLVNVIGESNSSDEYKAALKLKSIIQKTLPQSVMRFNLKIKLFLM